MHAHALRSIAASLVLAAAASALPDETITLVSGQVGGVPGTPGQIADGTACITAPASGPIHSSALGPAQFSAACYGAPAYVVAPHANYTPSLDCNPAARWIHSQPNVLVPQTVLYCVRFDVESTVICEARLTVCWAVDDRLGDPDTPNPRGVYLNGNPLYAQGGGSSAPTTKILPVTSFLNPGPNTLCFYARDMFAGASGLIYNAVIDIRTPPACDSSTTSEVVTVRTGQVGGAPGAWGSVPDNCVALPSAGPEVPYQATPFSTPFLNSLCSIGAAPIVVRDLMSWEDDLSCDPDARWIHWTATGPGPWGTSPSSVLYCFPFDVESVEICQATLTFCWAADDRLGDNPGEPNPAGVYLNGTPLAITGGGYTDESMVTLDVTTQLVPGANKLVIYQRDLYGAWSGLIASARFDIAGRAPCPTTMGWPYCTPAVPNTSGGPATLFAHGSTIAANNDVGLTARDLPPNQFGYFLTSRDQGALHPPGTTGVLCLGGDIGRFSAAGQVGHSGQGGSFSLQIDLSAMPVNPAAAVLPGDTWNFTCWFRDAGNTSNFSDGVSITFE